MISKIIQNNEEVIGFWGYPHPDKIQEIKQQHPNVKFIDLDLDYSASKTGIIPEAYCQIITNIIDNSMFLKNNMKFILTSIGEEKCNAGRFASKILQNEGIKVIETTFNNYEKSNELIIATSNLSLENKINAIMDNIISKENKHQEYEQSNPTHGFWGVPPNDFSILNLFPNTTHVYGWTRCVEAVQPSNLDLEMYVDKNIPTVFYAQTFCSKNQLAKYLAKKHNGLYVDVDDIASNSVKAKIEAFIRLG